MLRQFEEDDWQAVLAYNADPRYRRYYAWSERDAAAVRQFVDRFVATQREDPRRVFQLAIILPVESSRLIGNCGCG